MKACLKLSKKVSHIFLNMGQKTSTRIGPNLVPTWYQAGTKWYQVVTPTWYQAGTELVSAWYQAGTNLVLILILFLQRRDFLFALVSSWSQNGHGHLDLILETFVNFLAVFSRCIF